MDVAMRKSGNVALHRAQVKNTLTEYQAISSAWIKEIREIKTWELGNKTESSE